MTVTLPTTKTKPTTDLAKQSILLYGVPKLGKSSFASQFPEAMFFECEPGLNHLEVFQGADLLVGSVLGSLQVAGQGRSQLQDASDRHGRQRIQDVFGLCLCQAWHRVRRGHGPRQGWALVKNEWHRVLTRLASLPYGLILISHAVDKTIETRTGEYTKTTPSLPDRARNVVLGLVDIILYGDSVSRKDAAGHLVVERVLRTKPHPTYTKLAIALAACPKCCRWTMPRSIRHSAAPLRIQPRRALRPAKALLRHLPLRAAPQQERLLSNERLRRIRNHQPIG